MSRRVYRFMASSNCSCDQCLRFSGGREDVSSSNTACTFASRHLEVVPCGARSLHFSHICKCGESLTLHRSKVFLTSHHSFTRRITNTANLHASGEMNGADFRIRALTNARRPLRLHNRTPDFSSSLNQTDLTTRKSTQNQARQSFIWHIQHDCL